MNEVRFIGLCMLVMSATGFLVALPDFSHGASIPGPNLPPHLAVIVVAASNIASVQGAWKMTSYVDEHGVTQSYFVLCGEALRFENVKKTPPPSVPPEIPRLHSLCDRCAGVKTAFLTPASGAASHVFVTDGEALAKNSDGRMETLVRLKIDSGKKLVINAGGGKTIEINNGAPVVIANATKEEIESNFATDSIAHDNHFLAYYTMASTYSGRHCRALPRNGHATQPYDSHPQTLGSGCSNSQWP
jgi:hypothetical protein